jgi:hypothetical protein
MDLGGLPVPDWPSRYMAVDALIPAIYLEAHLVVFLETYGLPVLLVPL